MIADHISDDIPPQMIFLRFGYSHSNAFLHFFTLNIFVSCEIQVLQAKCHPTKCDITNDIKLFPTVYPKLSQMFDVIQLDVPLHY